MIPLPTDQDSILTSDPTLTELAPIECSVGEPEAPDEAILERVKLAERNLANAERRVAVLHIANALRQLLTERLLWDLQNSKLEIVRLCDAAIDSQYSASAVLPGDRPTELEGQHQDIGLIRIRLEELQEKLVLAAMDNHELEMQLRHAKAAQQRLTIDEQHEFIVRKVANETTVIKAKLSDVNGRLDEANAKLLDQDQLRQRIDAAEIENSALRKGVGTEVWRLKHELESRTNEVVLLKDQLSRRAFYDESQAKRLAEREATINRNVSELQRRENELRDAKAAIAGCTPEVVSGLRQKVKNLQEQVSISTIGSQQKLIRLQDQLDAADASVQRLLAAKRELEASLESAKRKILPNLNRSKVSPGPSGTLISLADKKIIEWMLEEASPEQSQVEHGYLSLLGDGPWSEDQLGHLMEQRGFSLWRLPDQDLRHVVVGRSNWDPEALEEQIASMPNTELRIYSQEMWFAKLVTGRDPFDAGDEDLLLAFARDHGALQYLIGRDNPWPEVFSQNLVVGDGVFTEGSEFGATSPLHNFGYQVGASSGLSNGQRRVILANFLEARSIRFDEQSSDEYRSHWGKPRSVQRLFRVALHIKWLIGWQGRSPFRAQANEEWTEDLKWLKKTYYKPTAHKFKWPAL
jgi:hypothetical protein